MRILQQALGKQGGADAGKSIAIEIMEGISSAMKLSGFRIICRVLLKKKSGLYRNDNTLWGPDLLFARKRFERCWNIGFSKRKSMSTVTWNLVLIPKAKERIISVVINLRMIRTIENSEKLMRKESRQCSILKAGRHSRRSTCLLGNRWYRRSCSVVFPSWIRERRRGNESWRYWSRAGRTFVACLPETEERVVGWRYRYRYLWHEN